MSGIADAGAAAQKKSLHASERDTPRVKALREEFRQSVAKVNPRKLVFVDESGANTALTPSRGRAISGERVVGAVPHGHWKVLTMLGALRLEGPVAEATVEAPTDSEVFRTFVRESLAPALRPGDVVVWDNLSPHRAAGVVEAVLARHAAVLPLPPYSPDFSPIEPGWSKVKQAMRRAEARTSERLGEAAGMAFASITSTDTRGWFKKCGYPVH
ncbi:MAG: IS630 family transposase [Terriglobia bacterium]